MKKLISLIVLVIIAVSIMPGCVKTPEAEQVLKFTAGDTKPFFTTSDKALTPSASADPADEECISKTIELTIANVSKIALEFISDDVAVEGLMFSVDSGEAKSFVPGVFYEKNISAGTTKHSVVLKVWLSHDTNVAQAGKSYVFTIKALAE